MVTIFLLPVVHVEHFAHGSFSQLLIEYEIRGRVFLDELDVFGDLDKLLGGN